MRVASVGPAYPYRGGIAYFNARLYHALRERGHELLAVNFKRQYPGLLFPGTTQEERSRVGPRIPSERLLDSLGPLSWWRVANRLARWQPDAVVFHYWMPFFAPSYGTVSRLVRRRSRTRVIWICHNITPHERQPAGSLLTRYGLASADAFVVMSRPVQEDLLRLRPDATHRLVPHPAYEPVGSVPKREARRRLGLDPEAPVLLFFGYVRPYKGLKILLQALREARREVPVQLVVAGEFYEPLSTYEQQVRELGLEGAVQFHNRYVPNEEVPVFFAAADAVVLPYLTATQSGIVPMAYAYGVPVITTSVGGLPEVVEEGRTGLLVPPGDAGALAQAIVRFYRDFEGSAWSEAVQEKRRLLSWDRVAQAVEELVQED
ncbi:MAG TPA: glycosyltransferase [Bacteroidetes bacterium]|nr:glycosyltransferase [Bacteroidota bacterium]